LALFWDKNAIFFAEFFGENILKIITSPNLVTLVRGPSAPAKISYSKRGCSRQRYWWAFFLIKYVCTKTEDSVSRLYLSSRPIQWPKLTQKLLWCYKLRWDPSVFKCWRTIILYRVASWFLHIFEYKKMILVYFGRNRNGTFW
jgi:hypothetical protein